MSVAAAPEVRHEDRRHEELHQRSAEEADGLPEYAEQGMPGLVDCEVEAIEPAVMARYGATRFERKLPVMIRFPPPAGRISKVPLSESPRTFPVAIVTTSAFAAMLW